MRRERTRVADSIRARLLNAARAQNVELQRLLVLYALERFLYRLGRSEYAEHFVLKGAMLFQVWEKSLPRATRDLDLLGLGDTSEPSILATLKELWQDDSSEDGLQLDHESLTADIIQERTVYVGLRVKCRVHLGNAVIPLQIDIGSHDAVHPSPELVEYPTLLDLPAPQILAYPKEAVVAEKTQIIVELGILNSRLKDYFDICYLARTQAFDGAILQNAMKATFERRRIQLPQGGIEALGPKFVEDPAKQAQWTGFQRRAGLEPEELLTVTETVRRFVEPVVLATAISTPFRQQWPAGGPWCSHEA